MYDNNQNYTILQQLAALLITRQVIGNIKEALVPWLIGKLKLFKIGYAMTEGMSPSTIEKTMEDMDKTKQHKKTDGDVAQEGEEPDSNHGNGDHGNGNHGNGHVEGEGEVAQLKTEKRHGPEGEMEITHSGPTLTQAEVEAGQKTVSPLAVFCLVP